VTEGFIKCLEYEYITQYLQNLNLSSTNKNMKNILQKYPLNKCEIQSSGWDNVTEMVDTLIIYPFKRNKLKE
jgi:hypothetical protein